jgi:hypothetical protein
VKPISFRIVGRKTGSDEKETLQEKYINYITAVSISARRVTLQIATYCGEPSLRIDQGQTDIFQLKTSVVTVSSFTSLPHTSCSCDDLLFLGEESGLSWAIWQEEVYYWDHQ